MITHDIPPPPPLLTTLGSVPHPTVESAMDFVRRLHASYPHVLPTWPQLSQGSPRESYGHGLINILPGVLPVDRGGTFVDLPAGVTITDWDVDLHRAREAEEAFSRHARGYAAFRDALADEQFGRRPRVKSPLSGPLTLATLLTLTDGSPAYLDPVTCDRLTRLIGALGVAMAGELRQCGAGAVDVWLDEPAWGLALVEGQPGPEWRRRFRHLIATLRQAEITVGMHCCAGIDFGTFAGLGLGILSFDHARYGEQLEASIPVLADEIEAGELSIAWGVIDTSEPDAEVDIPALVGQWRAMVDRFPVPVREAVLKRPIFSPACGMGILTVEQAEKVQARLVEFVQVFNRNHHA